MDTARAARCSRFLAVPTLAGDAAGLVRRVRPVRDEPLTFETVGIGTPTDVRLALYYRLSHERYALYWTVRSTR